jgi:Ca-activated chloride channel family protein
MGYDDDMHIRLTAVALVAGIAAALTSIAATGSAGVETGAHAWLRRVPGQVRAQAGQAQPGQAQPGQEVPTFAARSHIVLLHVTVIDRHGQAVHDLAPSAFEIDEDGTPQAIEFFEWRDAPIAAGLIIDSSSSMLTRGAMVRASVAAFASLSRPDDELFTIVFNEHVRFGLPPGMPFTRSHDVLLASLARGGRGGKTALHDAVIEGLAHLEQARNAKRVLVVLSDGDDNASAHPERNMLSRAGQSSAVIHTIWSGEISSSRGDRGVLRTLAEGSNGRMYEPSNEREMVETFETIARTIRRGYTIGYAPTNGAADGTYRRIRVRVHADDRRLRVLVRDGYTAPYEDSAH